MCHLITRAGMPHVYILIFFLFLMPRMKFVDLKKKKKENIRVLARESFSVLSLPGLTLGLQFWPPTFNQFV